MLGMPDILFILGFILDLSTFGLVPDLTRALLGYCSAIFSVLVMTYEISSFYHHLRVMQLILPRLFIPGISGVVFGGV
jgi:hypothetical protein